jgi:hypothetical protein
MFASHPTTASSIFKETQTRKLPRASIATTKTFTPIPPETLKRIQIDTTANNCSSSLAGIIISRFKKRENFALKYSHHETVLRERRE